MDTPKSDLDEVLALLQEQKDVHVNNVATLKQKLATAKDAVGASQEAHAATTALLEKRVEDARAALAYHLGSIPRSQNEVKSLEDQIAGAEYIVRHFTAMVVEHINRKNSMAAPVAAATATAQPRTKPFRYTASKQTVETRFEHVSTGMADDTVMAILSVRADSSFSVETIASIMKREKNGECHVGKVIRDFVKHGALSHVGTNPMTYKVIDAYLLRSIHSDYHNAAVALLRAISESPGRVPPGHPALAMAARFYEPMTHEQLVLAVVADVPKFLRTTDKLTVLWDPKSNAYPVVATTDAKSVADAVAVLVLDNPPGRVMNGECKPVTLHS